MNTGNRTTVKQREQIGLLYSQGLSMQAVATKLNMSVNGVNHQLKRMGIKTRTRSESRTKYSVCHDYFSEINTIDRAYFYGLMLADGCNIRDGITICLQGQDKAILEAFCKHLEYTGVLYKVVKPPRNGIHYKLDIRSDGLSRDLSRHGCVPAKSFIKEFPTSIPNYLLSHFIRGYFDGNGCVHRSKRDGQYTISFSSTKSVLQGIKEFLMRNCGAGNTAIRPTKHNEIYTVAWGGARQAERIYNLLYKNDSGLFLSRKKEKFAPLMDISELKEILNEETINK